MKYLVFLHGWGTTGQVWRSFTDQGRESEFWVKCAGFDSPPKSYSPRCDRPLVLAPDIDHWSAHWLAEWLTGLPLAETVVVGWSLGGMLLLETLANTGWRPAAVILMATPASFCQRPDYPLGYPPAVVRAMRRRLQHEPEAVLRDFALNCLAPGEEQFALPMTALFTYREEHASSLRDGLDYLLHKDLRPLLAQAPPNIAIIHGGVDQIVGVDQAFFLHQHLRQSRLYVLPGAGHAPFFTQTETFNKILTDIWGVRRTPLS